MPKFNIWYDIKGPGGRAKDIPNTQQPIEADDLRSVLERLAESLPQPFGCQCTKVVVEEVPDA